MIVAAVSRGHSFKGVTAYLANPREGQHRAEWTSTQNIGTDNVFMAARVMAAEAMEAKRKQPKGAVWHGVMSWDESRHPNHEHQKEAALALLKSMGLEKAQSLIVGHTDNGKTHAHIVVNLINPETGRIWHDHRYPDNDTRNVLYQERQKMQAWALDYCREHGIDLTPNREKNAAERENAKAQDRTADFKNMQGTKRLSRQEWLAMKDELMSRHAAERETVKTLQGIDWQMAKDEIEKRKRESALSYRQEFDKQKAIAKEESRPFWRDFFKRQEAENKEAIRLLGNAEDILRGQKEFTKKARDLCAVSERFEKSFIARNILKPLGFNISADNQRATLADARQREGEARARFESAKAHLEVQRVKHAEERQRAISLQGAQVVARTKANAQRPAPLDLSAMKAQHQRQWDQTRERQQAEREAAGIRPYVRDRDKGRDQERKAEAPAPDRSRSWRRPSYSLEAQAAQEQQRDKAEKEASAARDKPQKWGNRPLNEEAREELRKMRERDRKDREQGFDKGRER